MPTFTDLTELATHTGVSKRELDRIVRRLVRLYDPLRVYLFGSFAWGMPHWNSDLDFCVVVETEEQAKDKSKGQSVFYRLLHRATDFYLLSQGKFEKMISQPDFGCWHLWRAHIVFTVSDDDDITHIDSRCRRMSINDNLITERNSIFGFCCADNNQVIVNSIRI